MTEIGVEELRTRASKIVHDVRERDERYVVTYRGRPMALLVPLNADATKRENPVEATSAESIWEELERLGQEIGRGWKDPRTSAELISAMRR